LLATPAGGERFVRVIREWLGIDDVARREKSQNVYPEFANVSQAMEAESRAFIAEVLNHSQGTLAELLTANWTIADPALAKVYGVEGAGDGHRYSLAGVKRRGILNQGAFLSVFAGNGGSHPVFRGVALIRHRDGSVRRADRASFWNHLLVSIARAFGVETDSFGKGADSTFTTGALTGLT